MTTDRRPLVLGVGNRTRGDDGVGPAVTDHLLAMAPEGIAIRAMPTDAAAIMAAWEGVGRVVLVDACRSGAEVGAIRRIDARREALPKDPPGHSSHGFGLAAAIELSRALGSLPDELVVYAIEAGSLDHGTALSPAVAAAVPRVARRIVAELDGAT